MEAASVAHQLGGGAATYAGSRLLRALCDVQASHLLFSQQHFAKIAKGARRSGRPLSAVHHLIR
jgi:hypothetical protein